MNHKSQRYSFTGASSAYTNVRRLRFNRARFTEGWCVTGLVSQYRGQRLSKQGRVQLPPSWQSNFTLDGKYASIPANTICCQPSSSSPPLQARTNASNVGWIIRGRILGGSFTREQACSAFFLPSYRSCLLRPHSLHCKRIHRAIYTGENFRNIAPRVAQITAKSEFEVRKRRQLAIFISSKPLQTRSNDVSSTIFPHF